MMKIFAWSWEGKAANAHVRKFICGLFSNSSKGYTLGTVEVELRLNVEHTAIY